MTLARFATVDLRLLYLNGPVLQLIMTFRAKQHGLIAGQKAQYDLIKSAWIMIQALGKLCLDNKSFSSQIVDALSL